jgi:hypothetical protein
LTTSNVGAVLLISTSTSQQWGAFAVFYREPADAGSLGMTTLATEGPCTLTETVGADGGTPAPLGAGTVSIDVGGESGSVMKQNGVYVFAGDGTGVVTCATVRAQATGEPGGAPAFDLSAAVPARPLVTAPALAAGGSLSVPRSRALGVAWTGATGTVSVGLTATSAASAARSVACRVDGATGAVTMPASLLAQLPAGSGILTVTSSSDAELIAGDWTLALEVTVYGTTTTAAPASASVVLQ